MIRFYQQLKTIYHFFQAHIWRLYYGRPDRSMKLCGVTGTNGKTTTCYVLAGILAAAEGREKVGMLTTVAWRIGEREELNETKLTTLPSRLVYRQLAEMRTAGVRWVVIEMTSHALDQHRLAGIRLDGAIILNVTREHLDYHRTMEAYAQAKRKIVDYLKPDGQLVVKGDDQWISNMQLKRDHVRTFTAQQAQAVSTPLSGDWNKQNVLAASLLAEALGFSASAVQQGIASTTHVPGRMQWVRQAGKPSVLIDYAVTPDALTQLYEHVKAQGQGKIFAVLGAAGLRDRGKRPKMARAVAALADEIVLTREDPWTEDEEQIFADLEEGLVASAAAWQRIVGRREAISYCLLKAKPGDVVVVTGKGAERGMAIGRTIVPWHDETVIRELLAELASV